MSMERMGERGWIGVDLDGTLAYYDHWRGVEHVGAPVPAMLERVQKWLCDGCDVRIVTARVSRGPAESSIARAVIQQWCATHVGAVLLVTNEKDYAMIELWDDRCVQVEPNTGRRVDGREG